MGASSSKNVSKMMQTASINISTEVDQGSSTSASSSNMVSQVCNNVRAVSSGDGWTAKVKSIENTCYTRALQDNFVCSVPWTTSGDKVIVYTNAKGETVNTNHGSYGERVTKLDEAGSWCNESESKCGQCTNGEGRKGIWSKQSYDKCAELFGRTDKQGGSTTYDCVWMDDARKIRRDNKTVDTHCMPRCYNITSSGECNRTDGCTYQGNECQIQNPNQQEGIDASGGDAVGCRIKDISQSNNVEAVAKQLQDAAITNVTQQQLTQNLKQVATAMTSGINFGNFSAAENIGEQVANASTRIRNSIKQKCGAGAFAQNVVTQYCNQVSLRPSLRRKRSRV